MAFRSRAARHSSMPPSASYNTDSYRSGSVSRNIRSTSIAPARSTYRASSIAPVRVSSYRASSLAPVRVSAPYRASSLAPYRASSVTRISSAIPYSAFSMAPMRSSSVAPMRSSSVAPMRCSSVAPMRSSSVAPLSSSFRSVSVAPKSHSVIDTNIPTRQFGSRLTYQKLEKDAKPAIYDEYYGTTYIPSGGRDSWSAYRISDETLDDNDELVYQSAKKDHEVMKRINKQIVRAMSAPPPKFAPAAPATRKFAPKPVPQVIQVKKQVKNAIRYKPAEPIDAGLYRVPQPSVKVTYGTVDQGSDLLSKKVLRLISKERHLANEYFDFDRPAAYKSLKDRLSEAKTYMDKTRSYMSKYYDPEMSKIDAEVKAITSNRNLRAQSMLYEMSKEQQQVKDLRKRLRSTLRKSKMNSNDL